MEDTGLKSLKLPLFDGEEKNFQIWWTRFRAYAGCHGFSSAIGTVKNNDLPDREDEALKDSTAVGQKKIVARRKNMIAMANLTLAMTTKGTMTLIYESYSTEWPSGEAHKVVAALMKRYMPHDTMTKVELRTKLSQVSMTKKQNPSTIFEQIASIKNKYMSPGTTIDESELIAVVIKAAPKDYQSLITNEQLRLGTAIQVSDLEKAMNQLW